MLIAAAADPASSPWFYLANFGAVGVILGAILLAVARDRWGSHSERDRLRVAVDKMIDQMMPTQVESNRLMKEVADTVVPTVRDFVTLSTILNGKLTASTEEDEMPIRSTKRREEALRTLERVYAESRKINADLREALNELQDADASKEELQVEGLDRDQKRAVADLRATDEVERDVSEDEQLEVRAEEERAALLGRASTERGELEGRAGYERGELETRADIAREEVVTRATAALEASEAQSAAVLATFHKDREERKRSDRRMFAVGALMLALLIAMGFVLLGIYDVLTDVRAVAKDTNRTASNVVAVAEDTNRTATRLDCAFDIATENPGLSQTDPEANLRLINECVVEGLRTGPVP